MSECKLCLDKNAQMQVLKANVQFIEKQTIEKVLGILESHKTTINRGAGQLFFPIMPEAINEIKKLRS